MRYAATVLTVFLLLSTAARADTWVDGYTRSDGTYVQGHFRSDPDGYRYDNYSTEGNVNPYTGERGTEPLYEPPDYGYDDYDYNGEYDSGW